MSKAKKRKARIKLNETLNRQLDAMQDDSALEVFEPKSSSELNFYSLINEAMEQEEIQNNTGKRNKNKLKKGGKSVLEILLILLFCMMFVIFVYTILKLTIL
jgi:hypothetical protein